MTELDRVRWWARMAAIAPRMRDRAILRAYHAGHLPKRIAAAADLTTARIHQIVGEHHG